MRTLGWLIALLLNIVVVIHLVPVERRRILIEAWAMYACFSREKPHAWASGPTSNLLPKFHLTPLRFKSSRELSPEETMQ